MSDSSTSAPAPAPTLSASGSGPGLNASASDAATENFDPLLYPSLLCKLSKMLKNTPPQKLFGSGKTKSELFIKENWEELGAKFPDMFANTQQVPKAQMVEEVFNLVNKCGACEFCDGAKHKREHPCPIAMEFLPLLLKTEQIWAKLRVRALREGFFGHDIINDDVLKIMDEIEKAPDLPPVPKRILLLLGAEEKNDSMVHFDPVLDSPKSANTHRSLSRESSASRSSSPPRQRTLNKKVVEQRRRRVSGSSSMEDMMSDSPSRSGWGTPKSDRKIRGRKALSDDERGHRHGHRDKDRRDRKTQSRRDSSLSSVSSSRSGSRSGSRKPKPKSEKKDRRRKELSDDEKLKSEKKHRRRKELSDEADWTTQSGRDSRSLSVSSSRSGSRKPKSKKKHRRRKELSDDEDRKTQSGRDSSLSSVSSSRSGSRSGSRKLKPKSEKKHGRRRGHSDGRGHESRKRRKSHKKKSVRSSDVKSRRRRSRKGPNRRAVECSDDGRRKEKSRKRPSEAEDDCSIPETSSRSTSKKVKQSVEVVDQFESKDENGQMKWFFVCPWCHAPLRTSSPQNHKCPKHVDRPENTRILIRCPHPNCSHLFAQEIGFLNHYNVKHLGITHYLDRNCRGCGQPMSQGNLSKHFASQQCATNRAENVAANRVAWDRGPAYYRSDKDPVPDTDPASEIDWSKIKVKIGKEQENQPKPREDQGSD